jgi:hypothetical protein
MMTNYPLQGETLQGITHFGSGPDIFISTELESILKVKISSR